jgi:hypothetical protein
VKRSKAAEAFLYTDLPNVPLVKNYDGSNMQPEHFLPLIPTVLLNGIVGVAVGFSTAILPRALKDVVKATQDVLEGREPKFLMPTWTQCTTSRSPTSARTNTRLRASAKSRHLDHPSHRTSSRSQPR